MANDPSFLSYSLNPKRMTNQDIVKEYLKELRRQLTYLNSVESSLTELSRAFFVTGNTILSDEMNRNASMIVLVVKEVSALIDEIELYLTSKENNG